MLLVAGFFACLFATAVRAQVDAALQAKIDHEISLAKVIAADPAVVAAVKAHNAAPSADAGSMTQEKWKALTLLDPFIRSFSKNEACAAIKAKRSEFVTEAFLSGADGLKVAFLSKPSSWSHKGKPKHDQPLEGKVWQGEIEVDESTGLQQVQVAVPVLDGEKPIGSLVVGLSVTKMKG
jgi:sensor histidine kinase regulating citrate/malate metabolism